MVCKVCNYSFSEARKAQSYLDKQPPRALLDNLKHTMEVYGKQLFIVADNAKTVRNAASGLYSRIEEVKREVKAKLQEVNRQKNEVEVWLRDARAQKSNAESDEAKRQIEEAIQKAEQRVYNLNRAMEELGNFLQALYKYSAQCSQIESSAKYMEDSYRGEGYKADEGASRIFDANVELGKALSDLKPPVANAISAMRDFNSVRVYWNFNYPRGYFKEIGDK